MKLVRCDQCGRSEPADEASGWLSLEQDGGASKWDFCSVRCLATWSADAS